MLAHYDSNNSGSINTSSEVGAIPCDTWSALNDGVKEGYSYGIRSIYGFEAGYSWVGYAVGFDESQRATADSKLVSCVGP